jgi:hypothetical protein
MTNSYIEQTGTANPFNGINIGIYSAPTFADLDADGDLDALIGEYDGILNYYKNTGSSSNPVYSLQTGTANPFNGINVGNYSTPTYRDLDADGDLDALIGEYDGILNYYKNTGSSSNPVYTPQTGTANPFNGINVGSYSTPTLADWTEMATLMPLLGNMTVISTTTKIRAVAAIPFTLLKQEPPTPSMAFLLGISATPP